MKGSKLIKRIVILLVMISGLCFLFFLWMKSPNWKYMRHRQVTTHQVSPRATSDTLTVMSYNIGYLSGMTNNEPVRAERALYTANAQRLIELLKEATPDIMALQEVDFDSQRSFGMNQHQLLADSCFRHSYMSISWDKHYVPFPFFPPSVHFGRVISGQSILTQLPINQANTTELPKVASQNYFYRSLYLKRLLQEVSIEHPKGNIIVMNVHLEAFDQATRQQHMAIVRKRFNEWAQTHPVILMGDFNSDPNYPQAAINIMLNDPNIGHSNTDQLTYPSDQPNERLDYIFFTPQHFQLISNHTTTEFGTISDHLPVAAQLVYRPS